MTAPAPASAAPIHRTWLSRRRREEILANPEEHHPSLVAMAEKHASSVQLRVADTITAFAGSMWFVYVHIVLFAVWMLVFEQSPWPTLTLIVSLEAIFLSTFVMIGQNRGAAFQQQKADHDFTVQQKELDENTVLTREIHRLTKELHALQTKSGAAPSSDESEPSASAVQ